MLSSELFQYSPNVTTDAPEDSNEQKYLVKSSSKRSIDTGKSHSSHQSRSQQNSSEQLEWDCHFSGMYGSQESR